MSKKGGYLIIDLENIDLIRQREKLSDEKGETLYKLLESNYHKSVIISGIIINGIEKNDCITTVYHFNEGADQVYSFKIYGLYVNILYGNSTYSISTVGYWDDFINGASDETGVIKINFQEFPYKDNLCIAIEHATDIIMIKYNVIDGDNITGSYIIYNDSTVKIELDPSEVEYYTLTVTGGKVNGLKYELYYLG